MSDTGEKARRSPEATVSADVVETVAYGLPVAWLVVLILLYGTLSPVWRLTGATVCLLFVIKVSSYLILRARRGDYSLSKVQWLLYWTVWPGVRPDLFAGVASEGEEFAEPEGRNFVVGYAYVLLGAALVVASVLSPLFVGGRVGSWILLFGLLAVFHMGVGRILPFGLRWLGYPVPSLFDSPLKSRGVGDFWSDRWNYPFINMNRLFITGPLSARVGIGGAALVAFVVSGALHEMAISYPAAAGWGLPFAYFVVQGIAYTAEKTVFPGLEEHTVLGRVWTYVVVFAPLPLLFHETFRATFLVPPIEWAHTVLIAYPLSTYVGAGLWIGAAGHFLVLAASFQVPKQLDWDTDLESLQPLNRKLMWTYGGFIVLTIVSFGVLTVVFHDQFVAGTPLALGLCAMVAVFWSARILVDTFYFSHDDWPEGVEFVVGHALLTSLFLLLVVIYGGTVVFHLV